eukprot:930280-Amphidinium_carterae.1
MIHNVHIEDYMDESSRSIETINITNIQDEYTNDDGNRLCFLLLTLTSASRDSTTTTTKPFTRQYYKWLENINR